MKAALQPSVVQAYPNAIKERTLKTGWVVGSVACLGCMVLLLTMAFLSGVDTAIDGGTSLNIYVRHGLTLRPARSGDTLSPGDALELTYSSLEPRFVAVFGSHDQGGARLLFPEDGVPTRLQPGDSTPLLHTPVDVDKGGVETFYAVFCTSQLNPEPVRAALASQGELPALPASCNIDTVRLHTLPAAQR